MRAAATVACLLALAALAGLAGLAGCSGGSETSKEAAEATPPAEAGASLAEARTDSSAALDAGPRLQQFGYLRAFPEAGFRVYWPSGCGELSEQVSQRPTRRAEREFIYNCDRDGGMIHGVGVRVFQHAHDQEGNPPSPRLVTELIEGQLQKSGTRILRQRPLEAEGIQGVDVHSGEVGGPGEVWIRGLLAGTDIYLLMAWDQRGGLFEDIEVADFFASFRAGADIEQEN